MNIKQNFISANRSGRALTAKGIVVHSTATPGATDEAEQKYFSTPGRGASAHVFVDWDSTTQLIPWNEQSWHAGPSANHNYIGIELCEPKGHNVEQFNKVWDNAVELFAYLFQNVLKENIVTTDNLMSHAEVSNKWHETDHQDPIAYFKEYGKTVDDFRAAVQQKIKGNVIDKSQIVISSIKDVQSALLKLGYNPGPIDGQVGPKTTATVCKFQRDNGLVVDGIAGAKTKLKLAELLSK